MNDFDGKARQQPLLGPYVGSIAGEVAVASVV